MRPSTALQLLNVSIALGALVAVGLLWSWWASALVLAANLVSVLLDRGQRSLERGGE